MAGCDVGNDNICENICDHPTAKQLSDKRIELIKQSKYLNVKQVKRLGLLLRNIKSLLYNGLYQVGEFEYNFYKELIKELKN
jgi:hypothetical protein